MTPRHLAFTAPLALVVALLLGACSTTTSGSAASASPRVGSAASSTHKSGSSQIDAAPTTATSDADVCTTELTVITFWKLINNQRPAVAEAIGTASRLWELSNLGGSSYNQAMVTGGKSAGAEALRRTARQSCAENNNPILTADQLQSLYELTNEPDLAAIIAANKATTTQPEAPTTSRASTLPPLGEYDGAPANNDDGPMDGNSPNDVCTVEATIVTFWSVANDKYSEVAQAIGFQTPLMRMVTSGPNLGSVYRQSARQGGKTAGLNVLKDSAREACIQAGDPVLNRGQVEALYDVTNEPELKSVSYYGGR